MDKQNEEFDYSSSIDIHGITNVKVDNDNRIEEDALKNTNEAWILSMLE